MAGESIAQTVRRKLGDGTPPDEIVQHLVAGGLSPDGARRVVDRAVAESTAAPEMFRTGRDSFPEKTRSTTSQSVPLKLVLLIGVFPGLLWMLFLGWQTNQRSRAALAAADRTRADEIRAETTDERGIRNATRVNRRNDRLDLALKQLESGSPTVQCDAALLIGRLGSWENSRALADALSNTSSNSVRICAASALATLGDWTTASATYIGWINGDNDDLRRAAIMGFGDLGPQVAETALPYLASTLKSPRMDLRYLTVESLSKLGSAAAPLLETAARDDDRIVRERAIAALKQISARR